jgi:hypothetical protein
MRATLLILANNPFSRAEFSQRIGGQQLSAVGEICLPVTQLELSFVVVCIVNTSKEKRINSLKLPCQFGPGNMSF